MDKTYTNYLKKKTEYKFGSEKQYLILYERNIKQNKNSDKNTDLSWLR